MPLPLAAIAALQLAGPAIKAVGASREKKKTDKFLGDLQTQAEKDKKIAQNEAARIRGGLDWSAGPAAIDAYMRSQQDLAGDIAMQEAQRAGGSTLGVLGSAGSKAALGGAGSAADSQARMLAAASAESQARRQAGATAFSGIEEGLREGQRELSLFDYGRQLERGDDFEALEAQLGGMQFANDMSLNRDMWDAGGNAAGIMANVFAPVPGPGSAKEGAKVRRTPGEFSHDKNPIDLMRNGSKVGEVTGGELIFNPEQAGKIETLASDGDTPLHQYLRDLFKKFNSK